MSKERLKRAFARHQDELIRHVLPRTGSVEAAADLVQETFLRAWTMGGVEAIGNLRAYLFRMVGNLAIDRQRRATVERRYFDRTASEDAIAAVPSPIAGPDQRLIDRQRTRALVAALESLPDDTRRMFILFKLHGWPQKRIADHFGVSLSTVEKKIRLAVLHWRERVAG